MFEIFFRKNNMNLGVGISILSPFVVFGLFWSIVFLTHLPLKIRTLALMAICVNMLWVFAFSKRRLNNSLRGATFGTFGMALIWLLNFYQEIAESWVI
jgi:hypothetical protein